MLEKLENGYAHRLLKNCGMTYMVDWNDPIMAPKERDLMFIGKGVANV